MVIACRLLLFIIAAQLVAGVYAFTSRSQQIGPQIPEQDQTDPLSWNDLNELSSQVQRFNGSPEWQSLAEALIGKGFYIQGELAFREAVKRDPDNLIAAQGVAFCLDRTGRISESNKLYQQLVSKTAGETRQLILYAIARNHLRMEEPEAAEKLLYENYDFIPAKLMFNKLLVKSGRAQQALPLIDEFLRMLPQSLLFQQIKREALLQTANPELALQAGDMIERAELLIPVNFNTDFLTEKNQQYGFNRHWYEYQTIADQLPPNQKLNILQELQQGLTDDLSSFSVVLLKESARAAAQGENLQELQKAVSQLEKMKLEDADLWEFRGDLFKLTGEVPQAIECWKMSVSMTRETRVFNKLANSYEETMQPIKRDEALGEAALYAGLTAFRNNDMKSARELLEKSLQLNSENAKCLYYLAELNRLGKLFNEARLKYERCLLVNPRHGRAMTQLQKLKNPS